jgi:DNA-directed RNA polymerase specialized sigma24 family protein
MNETSEAAKQRIKAMLPVLNERQRRLFLASEAKAFGFGGISEISRISGGVSRVTITLGVKELETDDGNRLGEQRGRKEKRQRALP